MSDEDDIQIVDPDQLDFSKQEEFNHATLVSKAYSSCVDAGGVEMIKGFWETKVDKYGNPLKSYHSDTRQVFISCVETLKNVMIGDLDQFAIDRLNEIYKSIDNVNQEAIISEDNWFNNQSIETKKRIPHMKGHLNQDGLFYHALINYKVVAYRKIFEQLELQLKRTKYLKKKIFTN